MRQKLKHGNEFISVCKFSRNERNWGNSAKKNLGMEMSLFLYGNSAEMRGNEGKSCTLNIFIYVSLIGNGTWKNGRQRKI